MIGWYVSIQWTTTWALKKIKCCHMQEQMDLESIILTEINQMEKDKNYMISLLCGISNKKLRMNEPSKTHIEERMAVTRDEWGGG